MSFPVSFAPSVSLTSTSIHGGSFVWPESIVRLPPFHVSTTLVADPWCAGSSFSPFFAIIVPHCHRFMLPFARACGVLFMPL